MEPLYIAALPAHDLGEWFSEVAHEVGIEHNHIAEQGFGGLLIAIAIGTVIYLIRQD